MLRRALLILGGTLGILAVAVLGLLALANTDWGRARIIALVEDATADGPVRVSIGAIDGTLPGRIELLDVSAYDSRGEFARAGSLVLDWDVLDLLGGRVSVNALALADARLDRIPELPPTPEEPEPETPEPLSLKFELPGIEVSLDRLSVDALVLGADVAGEPVTVTADLSAALTDADIRAGGWIEAVREQGPPARAEIDAALVPSSGVLRAEISLREPEGGLVAGLLEIEGRPPLALSLTGQGGLERWQGALEGGFGPNARADLDLVVTSTEQGYGLSVDGTVAASRVAPPELRTLLAAPIVLALEARAHPDGSARLENLRIGLPSAELTGSAEIDAEGTPVAAQADLAVPDLAAFAGLAGTDLSGPLTLSARLDMQGRRLAVTAGGAPSVQAIALDDLALSLTAEADDALATVPDRIRLALDGGVATPQVDGVDTVDLLGPRLTLAAAGSVAPDTMDATVDSLTLTTAAATLEGTASFTGGETLTPSLRLTASDLSRFADLAGMDLSGAAEVEVDGTLDLDPLALSATLSVAGAEFGLGDPALERLIGPAPSLIAGIGLDAEQHLDLVGIELTADAAQATGDVSLDLGGGEIGGRIDLNAPDLSALSGIAGTDLSGAAAVAVALGGTLDAPAASASWRIVDLVAAGTPVDEITGSVTASGLPDAPVGRVQASLGFRGEPVDLTFGYALADGSLRVSGLSLDGLGTTVTGGAAVDLDSNLARGELEIAIADLGIVGTALNAPLAGGSVTGAVRLTDKKGQGVGLTLDAANLAVTDGPVVERVYLEASLADATGKAAGRVDLTVTGVSADGATLKTAVLDADVTGGVAQVTLNAEGEAGVPVLLAAAATVSLDPTLGPISVRKLDADVGDVAIRQRGTMQVALDPAPRIDGIDLAIDDGRVSGHAGLDTADLDIALAMRELPASLARLADPTLELDGRIGGDVRVTGPIENPRAEISLSTSGVRTLDPNLADIPPLVADLGVKLSDRQATAKVNASIGEGATVTLTAMVDGAAGPAGSPPVFENSARLDARLDADMDLDRVSAFLPLDLVALGGAAQARITAGGTIGDPALAGAVTVDRGRVDVPSAGLYLREATLRAEGAGQELVIRRFDAKAAGGGTISASGTLSADPETDFPADIRITADRFNASDMDMASVSVDMDLTVQGAMPEYLLAGKVTVLPTEIRIPENLPPSVVKIEVVEIKDGRVVEDPEEEKREEEAREEAGAPLRLDIEIDIPGQVFVRGRGLDSEWGGHLTVTGLADAPVVDGEISVRRGVLSAVGENFNFERGRVIFDGGPAEDPALDMRLTAELTEITASVVVGGNASDPDISLESTPALPEEDILSRILFGSDKAELTPIQALKLARSAAILSGGFGAGPGVTEQVRDALGVDTIDVDTSTADDGSVGASLSVGKYIAPGVFLKLQQGLSGASSRAVVEVEVTDSISVETDVGADSQSRVGVTYELDY
ncbi:translocation/assembly module TamB domain-containing protein [Thalassobaculum sp. OXR-137]|uniref:translocation/assembly module TamB domain-containing protein n=1 Tax=Thalassobaculum sp. OXR-137 TaxID=3100173 RepID=UPI002AC9BA19|nr:translocation/assembly module TamB domain-containing protein [Thalassobaculum sp. OXR-137]WPZ35209.1 translocation/assembly module TamB domain-containing protein [Thalassobaculum sp. OXR-137]